MGKITLDVDEKNLKTVLNILENLKDGLINDISTNRKYQAPKPVSSSINKSQKTPTTSKYLNPNEYKKRLKGI